jgi:hypothetical protein
MTRGAGRFYIVGIFIIMENKKKYQRPQIEVICEKCGSKFMKDGSEVRRNNKIGRKNFCSLNCSATYYEVLKNFYGQHNENLKIIKCDEYTKFREYLRRIKIRQKEKNIECTITLDDLLTQWTSQKGLCVYTGVELKHKSNRKNECGCNYNNTASLDRIDSKKGYIKGNIQFISISANHTKNNMTHQEMLDFCKIIHDYWEDRKCSINY